MKHRQERRTQVKQLCMHEQMSKNEPDPRASRWFKAPAYGKVTKAYDVTGYLRRKGYDVGGEIH